MINSEIKFHEGNREFDTVPEWVHFFLRTGLNMPSDQRRRIIFISMPCESAAPGLVTLGAMMSDLQNFEANDKELHKDSLLAYAKEYIEQDSDNPKLDGKIRKLNPAGKRPTTLKISENTNFDERRLVFKQGKADWEPNDDKLFDFYIGGNPPTLNRYDGGALEADRYNEIIPSLSIHKNNLSNSFSGIIYAGKNNESSRAQCSRISFEGNLGNNTLSSLLSVQGWSNVDGMGDQPVSRVAFFNGMTKKIDRISNIQPRLVVADSDNTFHKVYDFDGFRASSIVAIIDRSNMDRNAIDSIRQKMVSLEDYYTEDNAFIDNLTDVPIGISIRAFIK